MIALAKPSQLNSIDEVIHGEALAVLRTLPDNSVDAIVCDPPAGISFMGVAWDRYGEGKGSSRTDVTWDVARSQEHPRTAKDIHRIAMNQRKAFIAFLTEVMAEALRVLKPGGHAFVWALPRTSHWTGMALEDAGFEVRDVITHLFGSGFPKSMDVSKAIDKMQGAEREVVGINPNSRPNCEWKSGPSMENPARVGNITAPATPEASQWDGWGTALKPASEHWYLARKPLSEKSIAENVLKWGVGAINIDASRVGTEPRNTGTKNSHAPSGVHGIYGSDPRTDRQQNYDLHKPSKRFPSNLLLSHSVWCVPNGVKKVKGTAPYGKPSQGKEKPQGSSWQNGRYTATPLYNDSEGMETVEDWLCDESCPVRLLDEQSGMRKSGGRIAHVGEIKQNGMYGERIFQKEHDIPSNEGGASRYFQRFAYIPKASRAERNRGCEGLPSQISHRYSEQGQGPTPQQTPRIAKSEGNNHPTVKPLQLMRYLVRMITPPGGIVLDCFAGSGSTLVAAVHEGMHFIGIEMNDSEQEPYVTIARARIEQAFREVSKI